MTGAVKSDNTKIKLRWELQQTGFEDALERAQAVVKASEMSDVHCDALCLLNDAEFKLNMLLGPRMTEDMRYDYPLTSDSVVFDLGCYRGDFSARINEKYSCRVFAFEPVSHFFEGCYNRFSLGPGQDFGRFRSPHPTIHLFNMAVGGANGTVSGRESGDSSGMFSTGEGQWSAGMITMDVALAKAGVNYVDLVKINIEGSEFALLEDMAKKDLIGRFRNIQVQFHPVVPDAQARYDALQETLAETHYLTLYTGWQWQNWRRSE